MKRRASTSPLALRAISRSGGEVVGSPDRPLARSSNPKVAGSNPAPAIGEGLGNGAFLVFARASRSADGPMTPRLLPAEDTGSPLMVRPCQRARLTRFRPL